MTKEIDTKVEAIDPASVEVLGKKLTVWGCVAFAFSMLFAVISLRCLFADGSFYLLPTHFSGRFFFRYYSRAR
jgi:hypothetical protein